MEGRLAPHPTCRALPYWRLVTVMSPFSFTPRLPRGWPCNTAPALYPLRPSEGLCACAARWRWRTAAWWRWRDSNWSRAEGVGTRRSTSQTRWSRSTRTPRDGGFEHGNYRNSGAGREGGDERLAAGRRGGALRHPRWRRRNGYATRCDIQQNHCATPSPQDGPRPACPAKDVCHLQQHTH